MKTRIITGVAAILAAAIPTAGAAARACAAALSAPAAPSPAQRDITARDIVGLRDFGAMDNAVGTQAFSVSPNGKFASLIMRRADPDADTYCFGVVLVALDGNASPRVLDVGGEFIQSTSDIRGVPAIPSGGTRSPAPVWSSDGRTLAYLRRDRGQTRIWRVGLDGRPARQIASLGTDALAVRWSTDGRSFIVTIRPSLDAGRKSIEQEGRSGYHFDERFWTLSEDRPRPPLPLVFSEVTVDAHSGQTRKIGKPGAANPSTISSKLSRSGMRAWIALNDPELPFGPAALHVERGGKPLSCPSSICGDRVGALWWIDRETLLFMRAGAPDNGGKITLYRWRTDVEPAPRRILETEDALFGCQLANVRLICAQEGASRPREIVAIDPATGRRTTVFNPNLAFASLKLGHVERMTWHTSNGIATYGDLVLPPDHQPGQRHPLIVTQYISRGFLRGGTGDEYPIHLLAAHGYAVLSFQRPAPLPGTATAPDLNALQRVNIANWAERREIVDALEVGVDAVISRGVADPHRVGLTGMSDGATTAQFALNHSSRFAAAAISSCCDEPSGLFVVGLAYGDATLAWGYPPPGLGHADFWDPMSMAAHAATWRTPLLIQVPDMEYRFGLEAYAAFKRAAAPVDVFVFPDEHHLKWHPAHRLAVYERSLAWFDFWLRDRWSEDPARRPELRRWTDMKTRLDQAPAT
ncbi:Atxe2 family lasso peptide isopeptidase [Sphingomonas sp. PWP1-2]|uniref:Atxe2 family lasso peptide isopeptidase n=1 Tax=Sphingomonas sp. PWP1-2 TaxID=2804558 RepID=UPI003CF62015